VPFVSKINPDVTDYVTQKAIAGLFVEIAKEELNIRQNLGARTTPLLQKVFSFADKQQKK
jgi:ERCC4-related helicase